MPFYRFVVHGRDRRVPEGKRGFVTTRHAFGSDQASAAAKVLALLRREFTSGVSSHIWKSDTPMLEIEKAWPIGVHQLFCAPNKGSTFYDDRDQAAPDRDAADR